MRDTRSFFTPIGLADQMHRIQRHRFSKFIRLKRKLSSTHPMYQSSMPLVNLTSRSLLKSCPPLCFNTVKCIMHEWYSANINCALSQGVKCDKKSHQRLKYYPEQPGVIFWKTIPTVFNFRAYLVFTLIRCCVTRGPFFRPIELELIKLDPPCWAVNVYSAAPVFTLTTSAYVSSA